MKRVQNINLATVDINKSYVEIDGLGWRSPSHISVKGIMDFMQLDIPKQANLRLVAFEDQNISINSHPDNYSEETNLQLSMDENFLYVWVKDRWKRVPLSEF